MPLDKRMSHSDMVTELMDKYDRTGTIGNNAPKSRKEALSIANAIAYQTKAESLEESLRQLEECLVAMMDVFPVYAIGQVSTSGKYQSDVSSEKSSDGEKKLGDVVDNAN